MHGMRARHKEVHKHSCRIAESKGCWHWGLTIGTASGLSLVQASKAEQRAAWGRLCTSLATVGASRPNMRCPDSPAARLASPWRCSTARQAAVALLASTGAPVSGVTLTDSPKISANRNGKGRVEHSTNSALSSCNHIHSVLGKPMALL